MSTRTTTLTFQVTCTRQDGFNFGHESITHIGSNGLTWTKYEAISEINAGTTTFYTYADGKFASVRVVDGVFGPYLRTYADGVATNNLLNLPICY